MHKNNLSETDSSTLAGSHISRNKYCIVFRVGCCFPLGASCIYCRIIRHVDGTFMRRASERWVYRRQNANEWSAYWRRLRQRFIGADRSSLQRTHYASFYMSVRPSVCPSDYSPATSLSISPSRQPALSSFFHCPSIGSLHYFLFVSSAFSWPFVWLIYKLQSK